MSFKKLCRKLLNWIHSDEANLIGSDPRPLRKHNAMLSNGEFEDSSGLSFVVYSAKGGGKIIQTVSYDRLMDTRKTGLYIIANDDDFGEELSQIITREMLSR